MKKRLSKYKICGPVTIVDMVKKKVTNNKDPCVLYFAGGEEKAWLRYMVGWFSFFYCF
jgi:hypothetical protein